MPFEPTVDDALGRRRTLLIGRGALTGKTGEEWEAGRDAAASSGAPGGLLLAV